jgi:creatinine amidohydrolase
VTSLAALPWTEVQTGWLLAVPLGATEQHGPHLPLSTDTDIAHALTRQLASGHKGVVAAPPISYGASGEHQTFPGTLSIGHEALESILVELGRSASTSFPRVLFISTHGGNLKPVTAAVRRLRSEDRAVFAWSPAAAWRGDAHAGHTETSVMLALDDASVRRDALTPGNREPLDRLLPLMQQGGVAAVSPNGVLGDPRAASAEHGQHLLNLAAAALTAAVEAWPSDDRRRVWL